MRCRDDELYTYESTHTWCTMINIPLFERASQAAAAWKQVIASHHLTTLLYI